jgi:hypothetical protein
MLLVVVGFCSPVTLARGDAPATQPDRPTIFQRLAPAQLARFDRDRAALAAKIRKIDVPYPFVRGVFHAHSRLSHDSRGTIDEIVTAAKATSTRIIGLTEHPSREVDVVAENVKGWRDGVYFLAGTEQNNELYWPGRDGTPSLRFVAHPEEVETVDRTRYTGMEIYNTHSDAIDEPIRQLIAAAVLSLPAAVQHPEAAFCALLETPRAFLSRFDRLTRESPFAGLAANDSHQNQRIKLVALPDGDVEAFNADHERIWKGGGVPAAVFRTAFKLKAVPNEPAVLVDFQLDPYAISMRHVGTFLQLSEINERSVRNALRTGRICLGFEIVAPLPQVGFWIEREGKPIGTVGDQVAWSHATTLRCALPTEAEIRIIRNGTCILETKADRVTLDDVQPGVYRMEAHQTLAGRQLPWVLTNPIYVREGASTP